MACSRLFVSNLAWNVSEGDLRPLFEKFGTVVEVAVQRRDDSSSRGFAFVGYSRATEATKACEALNGHHLHLASSADGNDQSEPKSTSDTSQAESDTSAGRPMTIEYAKQRRKGNNRLSKKGQKKSAASLKTNEGSQREKKARDESAVAEIAQSTSDPDSPAQPSSKRRRMNSATAEPAAPAPAVAPPTKKVHSLAFINSSLIEANATSSLALQRLRSAGQEVGKNRFKNACRNALRAIEALLAPSATTSTSADESFKVSEFEPQIRRFFTDLCEIVRLTYLQMERSGSWDVARPGVSFQARGAVEKIYEIVSQDANSSLGASTQNGSASSKQPSGAVAAVVSKQFRERILEVYEKYDSFLMDIALRFETGQNGISSSDDSAPSPDMVDEKTSEGHGKKGLHFEALSEAIRLLVSQDLDATKECEDKRDALLAFIRRSLFAEFPLAKLEVFGSWAMGLNSKTSDLDLAIDFSAYTAEQVSVATHDQRLDVLKRVGRFLRISSIKNNLVDARVPLLVVKHETPRCDICIRESPRNAYRVALVRYFLEFLSTSSNAHGAVADCDGDVDMSDGNGTQSASPSTSAPAAETGNVARALLMIVKHWAKSRGLASARGGTLPSFAWILLVLQYLQCTTPAVLPRVDISEDPSKPGGLSFTPSFTKSTSSASLGELLAGFFSFYLDHTLSGICVSVRSGCLLPRRSMQKDDLAGDAPYFRTGQLVHCQIEDPFDLTDNCGRSLTKGVMRRVRREMARAARLLDKGDCQEGDDILNLLRSTVCAQVHGSSGNRAQMYHLLFH